MKHTLCCKKKHKIKLLRWHSHSQCKSAGVAKESLFMLPKGKCICVLKMKFCVASFRCLAIIIFVVFCFFLFTPSTCIGKKIPFYFLKIRVKSSFSYPVFGRSGCRCFRAIFPPSHLSPPEKWLYSHLSPLPYQGGEWLYSRISPLYK
jgi:hypothetical protein